MPNVNEMFPSKWLKASDLPAGGADVVIANIVMEEVNAGEAPKYVMHFNGKDKGIVLNKTNGLMIAHSYGVDSDNWIGKPIHLYKEPVQFQGKIVDAIRVRVPEAAGFDPSTGTGSDDIPW